jgi:geranyl-CoA carboxylase alpha subunit
MMKSLTTLLVANRGEIAVRIMRTAKRMGIRTVAVYSEADADAMHVREADQSICIGPAPVAESYLQINAILDAADRTGADCIHPGYGFLSENQAFASACEARNIEFIGPPNAAIEVMGDKARAKRAMIDASVPCVPGYQGNDQSNATLIAEANKIGMPVMVKAAAGGGGRGMRLVHDASDLESAIELAQSEAHNAFGSSELIIEKAVVRPRHVEIQVFADKLGNTIYLGERDCSIQRRHQKVVEEAPCPVMTPELRLAMGQAAVEAAKAVD